MNFASDNWAGASPRIIDAIARNAGGLAPAYGQDDFTTRLKLRLGELFGREVGVFLAATGTAANSLALTALCPPNGAILAHEEAHILGDEAGAPEFFTQGARLIGLKGVGGKLTPDTLGAALGKSSGSGARVPIPSVLSVTQATECGTVYRPGEIATLAAAAAERGLKVHMDGARFPNAVAFLRQAEPSVSLADITWKAGVDALCFGLTKNGALMAEAVILFDPAKVAEMDWRRKRSGHVVSKAWPMAAQILAMLEDDHWLELASHANAMAAALATGLRNAGHRIGFEVEANEVFAILPKALIARLRQEGARLYEWPGTSLPADCQPGESDELVRLVTSFATKPEEVELFIRTSSC